jgi:hypothetical protein
VTHLPQPSAAATGAPYIRGKRHGRSPPGASMQQPWASGPGHPSGRPSASTALFTLSSHTI